ncbi:hypothetical protein SAMN02745121_03113 [Nannocystis exedens]|uniref:Secreted protein n=1 Tax=Nannocystis exedens TaxID=54 RepID=A0A1I1Y214_9BACT|nr:hypothetical protein [Nannocystis exedens]PCC71761.1 hypothetical protein NAEX_04840 [Nannocystis exedens]SFE13596.1 hypothetical protein SAMN02745121_03113 [Nannocystis exedens]
MLRNILMVCPVLAVASLVASPTMARPLTAEPEQVHGPGQWAPVGPGDRPDQGYWEQGIDGADVLLNACVQTQIFVGTGSEDRSYDCDTLTGPACLARCADEVESRAATCRSQCEDGGALFCAPSELTARWGGWGFGPWHDDDFGPGWGFGPGFGPGWGFDPIDHIDPIDIDEQIVYIDTSTCLQLDLNEV